MTPKSGSVSGGEFARVVRKGQTGLLTYNAIQIGSWEQLIQVASMPGWQEAANEINAAFCRAAKEIEAKAYERAADIAHKFGDEHTSWEGHKICEEIRALAQDGEREGK